MIRKLSVLDGNVTRLGLDPIITGAVVGEKDAVVAGIMETTVLAMVSYRCTRDCDESIHQSTAVVAIVPIEGLQ